MDLELTGKVAVVTGGSRGIGKAIARSLANEGCNVVLISRTKESNVAAASELATQTGRRVMAFEADTGDDAAVRSMVASVIAEFGRIDILVNCAAQPGGQSKPPALADITNDDFWADMNVKVLGYLRTAREVAPHMKKQGWGRIINLSGLAARTTGTIIGSIRNVGVAALSKNLAEELGPHGINVTCVHPGLTRTEKTPGVVAARAKAQGVAPEAVEKQMAEGNTVRKLISAEQVADVVTFLASPKSIAINGDVIAAGGGAKGSIHY